MPGGCLLTEEAMVQSTTKISDYREFYVVIKTLIFVSSVGKIFLDVRKMLNFKQA